MATAWTSLINRMQRDRDNARRRQGARKEVEFGLDTYQQLKDMALDEYYSGFDDFVYENEDAPDCYMGKVRSTWGTAG